MRSRCSLFNLVGFLLLYAMLRLQHVLPWNPQGMAPMSPTSPSTRR